MKGLHNIMAKTPEQIRKWQRNRRKQYVKFIKEIKEYRGNKCLYCGYKKCIAVLVFHHRNPSQKKFKINVKCATRSRQKVIEELEKCDLICRNCHTEIHEKDWFNGKNQYSTVA